MRLIIASLCATFLLVMAALWWSRQPVTPPQDTLASAVDSTAGTNAAKSTDPASDPPPGSDSLSAPDSASTTAPTTTDEDDSAIAELNQDYPNLDMRLHEMNGRGNGKNYNAADVRAALFESSAWQASDEAGDKLELNDEQLSDGREFIQFKRLKLDSLVAGDQLEIPIGQTGKTYQAEITQAVVNADGSVTFNGQLLDELGQVSSESGSPYSITITSGQDIVSGGIFTPEGHFVLEAIGDQGWIANASTLFKFDENKPDFVVPDNKIN